MKFDDGATLVWIMLLLVIMLISALGAVFVGSFRLPDDTNMEA
mgnify:CR=1 FL=1